MKNNKLIYLDNDIIAFDYKNNRYIITRLEWEKNERLPMSAQWPAADFYDQAIELFDKGLFLIWLWGFKCEKNAQSVQAEDFKV